MVSLRFGWSVFPFAVLVVCSRNNLFLMRPLALISKPAMTFTSHIRASNLCFLSLCILTALLLIECQRKCIVVSGVALALTFTLPILRVIGRLPRSNCSIGFSIPFAFAFTFASFGAPFILLSAPLQCPLWVVRSRAFAWVIHVLASTFRKIETQLML